MQVVVSTSQDSPTILKGVKSALAAVDPAGRSLRNILFGVPALDGLTFAVAGLGIVAIGVLAASVPALRASRIDPVAALRQE